MQRFDGHDARLLQSRWRAEAAPIGRVADGERFEVRVPDSSGGQLDAASTRRELLALDLDRVDAATGPFEVDGARPGDALRVRFHAIETADWGWSAIFRSFGLLRDRFDDDLVVWRSEARGMVPVRGFLRRVPIRPRPMVGWVGVAPAEGELGMIPPQRHGGNLDNRLHATGAEVVLPVLRRGAGLMLGDVHAAQGDGEVCGTGIETPARLELSVELLPHSAPRMPYGRSPALDGPQGACLLTEGVGPDPRAAARDATEAMVELLARGGLEEREAYLLLSIAGHLRLSEVVDEPHWVVTMLFEEELARAAAAAPPAPSR